MGLDYLLSKRETGYISIANENDSAIIQEFLFTNGYHWQSDGLRHLDASYLFISDSSKWLTYSTSLIQPNYTDYKNITKEIYELAKLEPQSYEYW